MEEETNSQIKKLNHESLIKLSNVIAEIFNRVRAIRANAQFS